MPFKSESQRKWMYANHPEMAKRWQKHTPKGKKLPEHVEKEAMEKRAINEILLSLLAGGGLGGAGGAALAHKYHKRKIPQYEEQGAIRGYEEGFADAGKKLQDQLQESLAPVLMSISRRREAEEMPKAAKDMPSFTAQDRPEKVKEIYRALKRDHPEYPAETKARIAARKGKSRPEAREEGPPYEGVLSGYTGGHDKEAATAFIALALMKNAGFINMIVQQPPGMGGEVTKRRGEVTKRPRPMVRMLNRLTEQPQPQPQPQPQTQPQTATPAPKTYDLGAALDQDAESAQAIAEAHPSLGGMTHGTQLEVSDFSRRGESAEISRRARQSWPKEEVPDAPFEQFISEFKRKQMAPLW